MVSKQKLACIYCIVGALAIFVVFALTFPESKRAIQAW